MSHSIQCLQCCGTHGFELLIPTVSNRNKFLELQEHNFRYFSPHFKLHMSIFLLHSVNMFRDLVTLEGWRVCLYYKIQDDLYEWPTTTCIEMLFYMIKILYPYFAHLIETEDVKIKSYVTTMIQYPCYVFNSRSFIYVQKRNKFDNCTLKYEDTNLNPFLYDTLRRRMGLLDFRNNL